MLEGVKMDTDIRLARSQLTVALKLLRHRLDKLETTGTKLSRHYNTIAHTTALINLLEELLGVVEQDPDLWDDNPEIIPF